MVNKKGQMKIQQMAFMLIGVTLFLVMAVMFIIMIRFAGLQDTAESLAEKEALLAVSAIANSPEFSCEGAFNTERGNCIDADKLIALKSNIEFYNRFWGISGLEIWKIYPEQDNDIECTPENYPKCGKFTIISAAGGTGVSNFVSLCRKESNITIYDKCDLGRVIIKYGE